MSATRNSVAQQIEDLEDEVDDYAAMLARMECANQENTPLEVIKRLSAGEPPVRVWREHRGWALQDLATRSGLGPSIVSVMDSGQGEGVSIRDFAAIARALQVDLEQLVPWTSDGEPESE